MDKFIPPHVSEKLWSIFLTGLLAMLLAMVQGLTAAIAPACVPQADPAIAGTLGLFLRSALYSVRLV